VVSSSTDRRNVAFAKEQGAARTFPIAGFRKAERTARDHRVYHRQGPSLTGAHSAEDTHSPSGSSPSSDGQRREVHTPSQVHRPGNAIVHDLPGVTRDRHYAETDWARQAHHARRHRRFVPRSEAKSKRHPRAGPVAIEEADSFSSLWTGPRALPPDGCEIADILRKPTRRSFGRQQDRKRNSH